MLPAFLSEILLAISFLVRRPAVQVLPGWAPRLRAYACTFLIPIFVLTAGTLRPAWVEATPWFTVRAVGMLFWLLALSLLLWPLWYLRYAFSVVPAARTLVISGPYALVRHPMYAVYVLCYLALTLVRMTPATVGVVLVWSWLLWFRIRDEEKVLSDTFPEYTRYARQVGALLPRRSRLPLDVPLPGPMDKSL